MYERIVTWKERKRRKKSFLHTRHFIFPCCQKNKSCSLTRNITNLIFAEVQGYKSSHFSKIWLAILNARKNIKTRNGPVNSRSRKTHGIMFHFSIKLWNPCSYLIPQILPISREITQKCASFTFKCKPGNHVKNRTQKFI